MAKTKKITKRDNFNALLKIAEVQSNPVLVKFIEHELELLDRKNGAEKKLTPIQIENERLKSVIYSAMAPEQKYTISELQKNIPEIANLSNQKMTHLLTQMIDSGLVTRKEEKRKAYFTRVEQV